VFFSWKPIPDASSVELRSFIFKMVELKVEVPADVPINDCFISVRVGETQKLSRLSGSRTYSFPHSGDRRYGKIEVKKKRLELERRLRELMGKPLAERKKFLRELMFEYHPDKNKDSVEPPVAMAVPELCMRSRGQFRPSTRAHWFEGADCLVPPPLLVWPPARPATTRPRGRRAGEPQEARLGPARLGGQPCAWQRQRHRRGIRGSRRQPRRRGADPTHSPAPGRSGGAPRLPRRRRWSWHQQ